MREFFIQIKDGQPFEHPIARENMQQLFPQHDLDNSIPDNFAVFNRVSRPLHTNPYQKTTGPVYAFNEANEVYDKWEVIDLTAEEKAERQNNVKSGWSGPKTWIFDAVTCTMNPPKPYPGNIDGVGPGYIWSEELQDWELYVPPVPPIITDITSTI